MGINTKILRVDFILKFRPNTLGVYPIRLTTSRTCLLVSGETLSSPLSTREIVATDTPASFATCLIVGIPIAPLCKRLHSLLYPFFWKVQALFYFYNHSKSYTEIIIHFMVSRQWLVFPWPFTNVYFCITILLNCPKRKGVDVYGPSLQVLIKRLLSWSITASLFLVYDFLPLHSDIFR